MAGCEHDWKRMPDNLRFYLAPEYRDLPLLLCSACGTVGVWRRPEDRDITLGDLFMNYLLRPGFADRIIAGLRQIEAENRAGGRQP